MYKKRTNNKPFTKEDLKILRGNYTAIAKKHGVSHVFVSYLAHGVKQPSTNRAKAIMRDLKKLLAAYKTVL